MGVGDFWHFLRQNCSNGTCRCFFLQKLQELKVFFRFRHVPLLRVGEGVEWATMGPGLFEIIFCGSEVAGETDVDAAVSCFNGRCRGSHHVTLGRPVGLGSCAVVFQVKEVRDITQAEVPGFCGVCGLLLCCFPRCCCRDRYIEEIQPTSYMNQMFAFHTPYVRSG